MNNQTEKLVTENINLVYKYMTINKLDIGEHVDIFFEALCSAANHFNGSLGYNFSTYAYTVFDSYKIRYSDELFGSKNKRIMKENNSKFISLNDTKDYDNNESYSELIADPKDYFEHIEVIDQFESWQKRITGTRRKVLDLLMLGLTLEAVAKKLNVTKQLVGIYKTQLESNYKYYCETGNMRNIKGEARYKRSTIDDNKGLYRDI